MTSLVNDSESEEALKVELAKENPRKDVLLPLMKKTFYFRRNDILHNQQPVKVTLDKYKALRMPSVVCYLAMYMLFVT